MSNENDNTVQATYIIQKHLLEFSKFYGNGRLAFYL